MEQLPPIKGMPKKLEDFLIAALDDDEIDHMRMKLRDQYGELVEIALYKTTGSDGSSQWLLDEDPDPLPD